MKSPWALPRTVSLLVAVSTALVVLTTLALGIAAGTYAARVDFADATAIRNSQLFPDEPTTVRARPLWVSADARSAIAIVAEPVSPTAPAPFGLTAWPEPGQFLVSPDLTGSVEELGARFGELAGVLPDEALPSATSRTLLVRPSEPLDDQWAAAGFGVKGPMQQVAIQGSGFFLDDRISAPAAFAGIVLAAVLPALVLLGTALQLAMRRHARLNRTLEVLGVDPRRLHRELLKQVLPPLLVGGLLATGLVLVTYFTDITVPFAGFTVRSVDVQRHTAIYAGSALGGLLVAVLVAFVATYPRRLAQGNRPRAVKAPRSRPWLAVVGVAAVLVTSQVAVAETAAAVAAGEDRGAVLWVIGGSLIALCLMPAMVGQLMTLWAGGITSLARRKGSATALLLGRGLENSRRAAGVAAAGAALIVVTGLASTWALMGAIPAVQAQKVIDQIDGRFVQITPPSTGLVGSEEALAALPDSVGILTLMEEAHQLEDGSYDFTTSIHGSEPALEHWGLVPGEETPVTQLPGMLSTTITSGQTTPVAINLGEPVPADNDEIRLAYVAFNVDGTRVDRDAVQRAVAQSGGPGWNVSVGGENWVIGANDLAHAFRWIGWFAIAGGILLISAVWIRTVDDQRRQIAKALPVDALFSSHPRLPAILAYRMGVIIGATLLLGGGTAALFARVTSASLSTTGGSGPVIAAVCVMVAVVLGAMALPTGFALQKLSRDWTPGGARD